MDTIDISDSTSTDQRAKWLTWIALATTEGRSVSYVIDADTCEVGDTEGFRTRLVWVDGKRLPEVDHR